MDEFIQHTQYIQHGSKWAQRALLRWTISREELYLQLLVDALKQGQRAENGWKPQVYIDIIAAFRSNGFGTVTRAQLDNKRDAVRISYDIEGLH